LWNSDGDRDFERGRELGRPGEKLGAMVWEMHVGGR